VDSLKEIILEEGIIELRPATDEDLELLMAWRSHPDIYQHFYVQDGPLRWEEHLRFWNSRKDRLDWIIHVQGDSRKRKVGSVNVTGLSSETPEIGVYIGEVTLLRKGIGKQSVRMVIQWLQSLNHSKVMAHISKQNILSQKLFTSLGFVQCGEIHDGTVWVYEKWLKSDQDG
jgi:RimJ/RimL family protein N-acetyltransferase